MARTGYKAYTTLEEYDTITGLATGNTKPNISSDSDYVAPILDLNACPLGLDYIRLGTISLSSSSQIIEIDIENSEAFVLVVKSGMDYTGAILYESAELGSGIHTISLGINSGVASLYIKSIDYTGITKLSISDAYLNDFYGQEMTGLKELTIDLSTIPPSHGVYLSSIDISQNLLLEKLVLINHRLAALDLSMFTNLIYIDLHKGYTLQSLVLGDLSILQTLIINNIALTVEGVSSLFIDNLLSRLNLAVLSPSNLLLKYGDNNSTGVKPSVGSLSNYNSLIDKGVTIIGRDPIPPTSSDLTLTSSKGSDSVFFLLRLSVILTVDITIRLRGNIVHATGENTPILENVVMLAGTDVYDGEIYGSGNPISSYNLSVQSVLPNPAGGITINIINN